MDAEITVDWMGEVLKALARWFMPPKDMSGLPDAPQRFSYIKGGVIVGVAGGVGGAGMVGGTGLDGGGGAGFGEPLPQPYFPPPRNTPYAPFVPTAPYMVPVRQPIYDTETIVAGGAGETEWFTTAGYIYDAGDAVFNTETLNNG